LHPCQSSIMKLSIFAVALLLGSAVFGADEKQAENPTMNASNEVAVIKTSEGDMVVQFWNDAAPSRIQRDRNFLSVSRLFGVSIISTPRLES
jgi:hypothetical protein